MNVEPGLIHTVSAWLRDVPHLPLGDHDRLVASVRAEVRVTRQQSSAERRLHISAAGAVAVAAGVSLVVAGGILVDTRTGPSQDPGIAAVPSPGATGRPDPSASALRATWSDATYPQLPPREVDRWSLWSDGVVALGSAHTRDSAQGTGTRVIWVSTDAGMTWQRAEMVDRDGSPFQPTSKLPFSFTKSGDTYYAMNEAVLTSSDGVRWQLAADHLELPSGAGIEAIAASGLIAAGSIGVRDPDGLFSDHPIVNARVDLSRGGPVRRTPVVLTSTDGVTWRVSATLPLGPTEQGIAYRPLVAANGTLVVLGRFKTPEVHHTDVVMWRSTDGVTFERVLTGPVTVDSIAWDDLTSTGVYDGGSFVQTYAASDGSPGLGHGLYPENTLVTTLWTSPDGLDWTAHVAPAGVNLLTPIAFEGGILDLTQGRGNIVGRLLTPSGEWLDVLGPPVKDWPSGVQTGPYTVALAVYQGQTPILVTGDIEPTAAP